MYKALLVMALAAVGDPLDTAVDMVATAVVFSSKCKDYPDTIEKMVEVTRVYMDAANVSLNDRRFKALVTLKAMEFFDAAKNPQFCSNMNKAFEKGSNGG